ncbi:MAG: biliverdin-producing heme oxygenase [Microthrixaceae bacterium]
MTIAEVSEASGLARRLRDATAAAHRSASRGGLNDRIMSGTITVEEYTAMLGQLWHVYHVLELATDVLGDDPVAAQFVDRRLDRAPLLEADLDALGMDRSRPPAPLPETEPYLDRLASVAATDPVAFVAHHYTRYLGDLSGGQYMGRRVEEHLDLGPESGTGWYHFEAISDPDAYKAEYRARLDRVELGDVGERRLVEEVLVAYELNQRMLDGIDRLGRGA